MTGQRNRPLLHQDMGGYYLLLLGMNFINVHLRQDRNH